MEMWIADDQVQNLLADIKAQYHPRLEEAKVTVCFTDARAFVKNHFNWGKSRRFPPLTQLFAKNNFDFLIELSREVFEDILNPDQRKAMLDLRLECCRVDYLPQVEIKDGKKAVVRDEYGRTVYTDQIKRTADGVPVWKVVSLDLPIIQANVRRFGCWTEGLLELKEVMSLVA